MKIVKADLELLKLSKRYPNATTAAVDELSLRIKSGEFVSLLGPSGCGKTTTLRMIAGLVDKSSGDILIEGATITDKPVHKRNIGVVFQNYALFPHLTVEKNIEFGLQMRNLPPPVRKRRVDEAIDIVQLSAFRHRLPQQLSGGQQQRVALARALVIEPSVLLLDEPLGALDKSLREDMQLELRRIQQRLGITTVIVTHDQEEALTLSDRIVIMNGGKLEQVGTPKEIYCRPKTRFVAQFIGDATFITGRVRHSAAGITEIDAGSFGVLCVEQNCAAGETVEIAVRPEDITLSDVDPRTAATPNRVTGIIREVLYKGLFTRIFIHVGQPADERSAGSTENEALTPTGSAVLKVTLQNRVADGGTLKYFPGQAIQASWHHTSNIVLN